MRNQAHQSSTRTVRTRRRLVGVWVEVRRSRKQLPRFGGILASVGIATSPETAQGGVVSVGDDACATAAVVCWIVLRAIGIDAPMMAGVEGCPYEAAG